MLADEGATRGEPDVRAHDVYEKRLTVILRNYFRNFMLLDIIACVPLLLFEARYGFATDLKTVVEMMQNKWY